jgi:uncharacterized protein YndB with AHSA1/START domain
MTPHRETYEHLGEIALWVQDLRPVWQRRHETDRITIPPNQVALRFESDLALPPEIVWDYLSQPETRSVIMGSDRQAITGRQQGRVAPGSVYQCYHGNELIRQTILEWRPFEHMVSQDLVPIPIPGTSVLVEFTLAPTPAGTHLAMTFSKARGPRLGRLLVNLVLPGRARLYRDNLAAFKARVEATPPSRPLETKSEA